MAGNLNVTDGDLQSLADALENMKGTLHQKIGTLNGVVESTAASWKGDAATAYQNLQRQVNDDARRLNEILEFIKEAVIAAKGGFSDNEENQLSRFKNLQGNNSSGDNRILDALSG
jgi:WXG100 family type VII secretion target